MGWGKDREDGDEVFFVRMSKVSTAFFFQDWNMEFFFGRGGIIHVRWRFLFSPWGSIP